MGWKSAGRTVLRWAIWLFAALIFLRGVGSFFRSSLPIAELQTPAAATAAEPAGLRAFPAMFAREYLTWRPGQPEERAARLQPYLAKGLDSQAGWTPGRGGTGQNAAGAWVYSLKPIAENRWQSLVAVMVEPYAEVSEFDGAGAQRTVRNPQAGATIYLQVPVAPTAAGGWAVSDYPSLVPAPPTGGEVQAVLAGDEVKDQGDRVKVLMSGFFKAYLGGGADLAYFVMPGASLPRAQTPWTLDSVSRVTLLKNGSNYTALTDVTAIDPATGARFTNRYTVSVVEKDGRWLVKELL